MTGGTRIVPLDESHNLDTFTCGDHELDSWLRTRALKAERSRTARTHLLLHDDRVVGFFALAAGSVKRAWLPKAMQRNTPDPVPVIILARLAVNAADQSQGHAQTMLALIVEHCLAAGELIGATAILVHTGNQSAASFYTHFDFVPLPGAENALILQLSDLTRELDHPPT